MHAPYKCQALHDRIYAMHCAANITLECPDARYCFLQSSLKHMFYAGELTYPYSVAKLHAGPCTLVRLSASKLIQLSRWQGVSLGNALSCVRALQMTLCHSLAVADCPRKGVPSLNYCCSNVSQDIICVLVTKATWDALRTDKVMFW